MARCQAGQDEGAKPAASAHKGGTALPWGVIHSSKVNSASMVPSKPVSSTGRSPQRSVAMPHGNSVRATPRAMAPSAVAVTGAGAGTGTGVAGLWAAAAAGLGVTVRTSLGLPSSVCALDHVAAGLPALPPLSLELLRASSVSRPPVERLAGLIIESLQAHG